MKEKQLSGHIVNLNSVAGHQVPAVSSVAPSVNIYPATKFALNAMTETFRQEFRNDGSRVKITVSACNDFTSVNISGQYFLVHRV